MQPLIHAVPDHRRQRGGMVLHALAFLVGAATGWVGWQAVLPRSPLRLASLSPNLPVAQARAIDTVSAVITATNGALIIPVKDAAGIVREPMVLLPVQARRPHEPGTGGQELEPLLKPAVTVSSNPPATALMPASVLPSAKATSPTNSINASNPTNSTVRLPAAVSVSNRLARALVSAPTNSSLGRIGSSDRIMQGQVGLVRQGFSPGSVDGLMGAQTKAALRAFQQREGLPASGSLDDPTFLRLAAGPPVYTNYVVTPDDVERLVPLSKTWIGKSQQPRLDFESVLELVAEQTFSHPNLVRRLNPEVNWTNLTAGAVLKVPAVQYPEPTEKAAFLRIRLADRTLQAFGAASNLLAHFPCSIAQRVEKRPVGEELRVAVLAPDPNYTFDPAVFPESAEARDLGTKLILQPGPNNPVGSVWIGLDKPGYGIHGTPKPEEVGRTESHGCFRLANWNVRHLLKLVILGTPVEVIP